MVVLSDHAIALREDGSLEAMTANVRTGGLLPDLLGIDPAPSGVLTSATACAVQVVQRGMIRASLECLARFPTSRREYR